MGWAFSIQSRREFLSNNKKTVEGIRTAKIIYEIAKENNIEIPPHIAGLMLSGILSDTLILTSPTTTEFDKIAVNTKPPLLSFWLYFLIKILDNV